MAGIMAPNNYPVRNPKTRPQMVGRIVNPVGFPDMGGLTSASRWPNGNRMRVERPTGVRGAHKSSSKDQE